MIFEEEQYFRQRWLWFKIALACCMQIGASIMLLNQQEKLIAAQVQPPTQTYVVCAIMLVMVVVLPVLFWKLKMTTRVDAEGIKTGFPLQRQHIAFADLRSAIPRSYRPIREYGGWGIRFTFRNGRALNVSGHEGVQLEFTNGKKLMIGSQRAQELARVINHYRERR